jgi:hypothetical protein
MLCRLPVGAMLIISFLDVALQSTASGAVGPTRASISVDCRHHQLQN